MKKQIKQYHQLTREQRYQLEALYATGATQRQIAKVIGVHYSTVSRELQRNTVDQCYQAETANSLKDKRMLVARKSSKSHDSHGKIIYEGLLLGWSPENISGRMRLERPSISLSHTTIYRRIAADKANDGDLLKMLPRFGKRNRKGGKRGKAGVSSIPNRVDMSQRPEIVNQRSRIGDFEGDTIHSQQGNLVTLVDRTSRLVLIGKASNRAASEVTHTMNN